MSTEIDNKVVSMEFDNKNFESNVKTSMSTIDKLKQSLDFGDTSKGLEAIQAKFSAFQVVAVTALANITNSAINAGKELIKSLSVDNISAGWQKFADKTTSVGTLISQGYDMETVTDQLERLNWFTDETSYNFTDMVANIAKFTASGQDLETSVTALEGIATWAALSGQNAGTASRAMYQLSQAMGAGVMRKEDYKSIQNVSMDTDEFRQKAIDAAIALGKLKKNSDDTYSSLVGKAEHFTKSQFADSLTQGAWFTSEVMMKVFNEYSGAIGDLYDYTQKYGGTASDAIEEIGDSLDSFGVKAFRAAQEARTWTDVIDSVKDAVSTGWMNTFELIFGNYEEAKTLWTDLANELYDVFAESGNRRNEILEEWKNDWGGRDNLIQAFWNTFNAVRTIIDSVKDAFRDIFPEKTAFQLAVITRKLMVFTKNLQLSEPTLDKIKSIFRGLFAVLDIGKQAVSALWNGVKRLISSFRGFGGTILNTASSFGDWLVKLDESIKEGDIFNKVITRIVDSFIWVRDKVKLLFDAVKNTFGKFGSINTSGLDKLTEKTSKAFHPLITVFNGIKTVVSKVWEFVKKVANALKPLVQAIGNVLKNITKQIADSFKNFDLNNLSKILNEGLLVTIALGIKKFIGNLTSATDGLSGFGKNITGVLNGVKGALSAWQADLKSNTLLKLAAAIAILTVSLIALSGIDADNMMIAIGGITLLFKNLTSAMASISKVSKMSRNVTKGMIPMAAAVLIMAIALKQLSTIDFEQLLVGLAGISGITAVLVIASKTLSKNAKKMMKGSIGLIAFALAIRMLVKPVKQLGSLDIKTLGKGLLGIGALFTELALAMKLMPNGAKMITDGLGLIAVAAAMKIFASALSDIADMSWEGIGKGLAGIAGVMLSVAGAMKLMPNSVKVLATSTGLIAVGLALKIIASAMKDISNLSWEEIGKGLAGIAGSLLSVTAAIKLMPNSVKVLATSTGLIAVAAAMVIMAEAMKSMAGLSWEELAKGLTGISVSLLAVAGAIRLMPNSVKVLATSTGLIAVAAAMVIMGEALKSMSSLSWEELAKGLVAISSALLVIAASIRLMPNSVKILAASSAIAIMVASLALLAPILKTLGTMSWGDLAVSLIAIAGVFGILGAAGALLTPVVGTIYALAAAMALIGVGAAAFGVGLLAITLALDAFSVSAQAIAQGIVDIVITLVTAIPDILKALAVSIKESVPAIIDMLVTIVKAALSALVEIIPTAVETLLTLIQTTLDMLAQNIKPIISALMQIIVNVLDGLAEGIPQVVASAVALLKSVIDAIFEALGGFDLETIISATAALTALSVMMALLAVIALEATVATALLPVIGKNLNSFIEEVQPFLEAIKNVDQESLKGAKLLAETILILTAAGLIDSISSWFGGGGNSIVKFGKDLANFAPYLRQYSEELGDFDSATVTKSAYAAKALAEFAQNIPNSGGVISWIAGDNSLTEFAKELPELGTNLKAYSDNVTGLKADVVINSATAALAIAELATKLPNSGGVISWIAGDNSLVDFSAALPDLGKNLKAYSDNVTGLDPEVVVDSANAALALSELAHNLPNSGGVISWIAGDNSLVEFSAALPNLGENLKFYSDSVKGLEPDVVINSANAAQALSELASNLPNSGGVISWFAGDNSLVEFAAALPALGLHLKSYSDNVKGLEPDVVINSANAAKALAEMASNLPNSGGVASWFAGENDLSDFAEELSEFGPKLKDYAESVDGLKAGVVVESANAAKALAEMAANLPNTGGVVSWFAGDNLLSEFADELSEFGPKLMAYSKSVTGLKAGVVIESANAALAIANLANNLPNSGGIVAVFTGDNTLSTFADELAKFGPSLMSYAQSVDGLKSSVVVNSISAASALAELASNLPSVGGIGAVFSGDSSLSSFARELSEFGPAFKSYATSVDGIEPSVIVDSANAAKALTEMANNLPETGGLVSWFTGDQDLGDFGDTLAEFGEYFKEYYEYIRDINVTVLSAVTKETNELIKMAENMKSVDTDCVSDFGDALEDLGDSGVEGFITAFTNAKQRVQTAGQEMIDSFTSGASGKTDFVNSTFSTIIDSALTKITSSTNAFETNAQGLVTAFVTGIQNKGSAASGSFNTIVSDTVNTVKSSTRYWDFYNAGTYLVEGFSDGISARTWRAKAKSAAMAQAALDAAKETLKIRSPSKEAYKIGGFTGQGFVNALEDYESIAYRAGSGMADYAMEGIGNAIVNVSDLIETGIDSEPTIKPVIDLTDVQNGANQLYRLMNGADYAVTGSLNMANQAATGVNRSLRNTYNLNDGFGSSAASTGTSVNSSTTFENTFNITGDNPRDIANEVSRIIQQQVERRNASWA